MKKRLGMNSILREKKGQWWENNGFHTERGKGSMLVNFILHFFLEILQRFCEVGILGNFGRPGHAHNDWMVLYRRIVWCLSTCKKSTSSLLSFLRYCKESTNLLCWVLWACLAMTSKKRYHQLGENFDVYLHAKNHIFPSPLFLKYYKNIACLAIPLKSDSRNLQETLMFICKPNINLIHQFFSRDIKL